MSWFGKKPPINTDVMGKVEIPVPPETPYGKENPEFTRPKSFLGPLDYIVVAECAVILLIALVVSFVVPIVAPYVIGFALLICSLIISKSLSRF